jgi:lysozyme
MPAPALLPATAAIPIAAAFLRQAEALRLSVYCCEAGVPTNGYGHTGKDVRIGMPPITIGQAELNLRNDIEGCLTHLQRALKVQLNPNQLAALIIILFNVGPGSNEQEGIISLKDGRPSTLLRLVNEGNFPAAADQFRVWNKILDPKTRQLRVSQGLVNVREKTRDLFLRPWPDQSKV